MEVLMSKFPTFGNIFPDDNYDIFKTWYKETGLSDDETDVPSKKTFLLISNEFYSSHSCLSEEDFKRRFANDIYTYYKEFEATSKGIIELMSLTDEQIATADSMIMNIANTPETELTTDTEDVDFISQHQKTISKKGNLQIKREQLSNKRAFTVKTFLNRFRHLFVRVISPAFLSMIEDED